MPASLGQLGAKPTDVTTSAAALPLRNYVAQAAIEMAIHYQRTPERVDAVLWEGHMRWSRIASCCRGLFRRQMSVLLTCFALSDAQ